MWRGVIVSCSIIAACLFPLAIAGYWAYGNRFLTTWSSGTSARRISHAPRWVRVAIRVFFGGPTTFIAVAVSFLGSLGPLIGGIALPLTLAYPCIILSALLVAAAMWKIVDEGIEASSGYYNNEDEINRWLENLEADFDCPGTRYSRYLLLSVVAFGEEEDRPV
ncbi:hypothetical protein CK203_045064 [Vitis vinifera]|uniref:Uncharacterized protein n=1 Tax=Vitis vinifera TaxID=29760 RepID=A0A438HWU6_VITVI|nr:hypothetical protein CK203_045064 [Vitis vinifera]